MRYVVSDSEGLILYSGECPERDLPLQVVLPGYTLTVVDSYDCNQHTHIENGVPVGRADKLRELRLQEIRQSRDQLLDQVDLRYCNPDKWEAMTAAEKKAWRDYKQLLRDFTSTCDPDNPVWPEPPK